MGGETRRLVGGLRLQDKGRPSISIVWQV